LQRNFTTVFVLTILALVFQPEKVQKWGQCYDSKKYFQRNNGPF
jgi:hypothetical protein